MVLFDYKDKKKKLQDIEAPALNIKTAMAVGASPDSAKMAQTPQVLQSQLKRSFEVADASKAASAERSKIEAFDEAAYKASQDLIKRAAELNSLEARIPNILLNKLKQQTSEASAVEKVDLSDDVKSKLSPQILQAIESGAPVRKSADGDQVLINGVWVDTEKLGADLVYRGVSSQKLKDVDEVRQIAEKVATAIPDRIDAYVAHYNRSMTHEELQRAMREELSLLNKAAREKFIFSNLTSSLAERAAQSAALGTASRYSPEEKVNNILAQIESADTVQVFGRQVEIKDLLDNDFLRSVVKSSLENPAELERLKKDTNYSELGFYIEKNQKAWRELFKTIEAVAGGVDAAKNLYDSVTRFNNGAGDEIPRDLLLAVFPQFDDIRALYTSQGKAALAALKNIASLSNYQGKVLSSKVQALRDYIDVRSYLSSADGINTLLTCDPNEVITTKKSLDAIKNNTYDIFGPANKSAILDYYNINFAIQNNRALAQHPNVIAANRAIENVIAEINNIDNELRRINNPFDPRAKELLARLEALKSTNLQALVNTLSSTVAAVEQEQAAQERARQEIERLQKQAEEQKRREEEAKFKADFDRSVNTQYQRVALGVNSGGFVVGNETVNNMLKSANNLLGAGGHEFVQAINQAFVDNPAKWSGQAPKQLFDLANQRRDADPTRLAIAVYRQPQSLYNMMFELIKLYARKAGAGAAVENNYGNYVRAKLGHQPVQPNNAAHAAKIVSATIEYLRTLRAGPRDKYLKPIEDLLIKVESVMKTKDIFPGYTGQNRQNLWK